MPDPKVGKELFNRLTPVDYFDFIAKNISRERAVYSTYLDIIDNTRQAILRQKREGGHAKNKTNDPNRKSPPPEVLST